MSDLDNRPAFNIKPGPSEYGSFYQGYIDCVPDGISALKILKEQQSGLIGLLENLDDEDALYKYAPGKWSIKQVLGHMIDTERIFAYRALSIARGEEKELPGFDQNKYVEEAGFDKRTLNSLVDEYKSVRKATIELFGSFTDAMLGRQGIASSNPCSVRALVFILAGHENHHIRLLKDRYGL